MISILPRTELSFRSLLRADCGEGGENVVGLPLWQQGASFLILSRMPAPGPAQQPGPASPERKQHETETRRAEAKPSF